jgi:hypothetical protein
MCTLVAHGHGDPHWWKRPIVPTWVPALPPARCGCTSSHWGLMNTTGEGWHRTHASPVSTTTRRWQWVVKDANMQVFFRVSCVTVNINTIGFWVRGSRNTYSSMQVQLRTWCLRDNGIAVHVHPRHLWIGWMTIWNFTNRGIDKLAWPGILPFLHKTRDMAMTP